MKLLLIKLFDMPVDLRVFTLLLLCNIKILKYQVFFDLLRGRPRNGTRIGRKTLAGMGGPLGGPEGLEAGLEGWGRVRVWRGLGDGTGEVGTGMRDGVALSWELGVEVGWGRG